MDDAPVLEPDPRSVIPDMGSGIARAGFVCGVSSFVVTLLAAIFASGLIPDRTSGEGMLLFLFVALPLAFAGLGLSFGGRHPGELRALGIALALVALLGVGLAVLVVYLSWSRCGPSCL